MITPNCSMREVREACYMQNKPLFMGAQKPMFMSDLKEQVSHDTRVRDLRTPFRFLDCIGKISVTKDTNQTIIHKLMRSRPHRS